MLGRTVSFRNAALNLTSTPPLLVRCSCCWSSSPSPRAPRWRCSRSTATASATAHKRAREPRALLEGLLQKPDDWLGANLVILAAASSSLPRSQRSSRSAAATPTPCRSLVAVLTVVVIVFCELAPKIYAASNPEGVALHAALIYSVLVLITRPVLWLTSTLRVRVPTPVRRRAFGQHHPVPERRRAAHSGRRGGARDPGAPPADAAVDPGSGQHHGERHHDPAPGDLRHRCQRELGGHPRRSCVRPRTRGCRCTRANSTISSACCT